MNWHRIKTKNNNNKVNNLFIHSIDIQMAHSHTIIQFAKIARDFHKMRRKFNEMIESHFKNQNKSHFVWSIIWLNIWRSRKSARELNATPPIDRNGKMCENFKRKPWAMLSCNNNTWHTIYHDGQKKKNMKRVDAQNENVTIAKHLHNSHRNHTIGHEIFFLSVQHSKLRTISPPISISSHSILTRTRNKNMQFHLMDGTHLSPTIIVFIKMLGNCMNDTFGQNIKWKSIKKNFIHNAHEISSPK